MIFPPSTLMTWHAGSSIRLFDGAIVWVGVCSTPVCAPFHTTSMMAVSPLVYSPTNVAFESGRALAQPCQASMISLLDWTDYLFDSALAPEPVRSASL